MKKHTGFTLLELMVMMAVAAIIVSVGLPQMSIFFKSNRMVTNTNDLVSGLHIARSEALKRGANVSICKSNNANTAAPTCIGDGATGGWEKGWLVFSDDAINGVGVYSAATLSERLLKINAGAQGSDVTITASNTSIADFVSFSSRGVPKNPTTGAFVTGVFKICDERGLTNTSGNVVARGVEIVASGRSRFTSDITKIGSCL